MDNNWWNSCWHNEGILSHDFMKILNLNLLKLNYKKKKDVGEAVRDNITALDPNKNIVLLGIANWVYHFNQIFNYFKIFYFK
jgi:hypothetical protein